MKITISQEGSAPIVLDTGKRSSEATAIGHAFRLLSTVNNLGISNGAATALNKFVSLGTYDTVKELLKGISPKVATAYTGKDAPTVSEAKNMIAEKKGTMKSGFWSWYFTGNAGDKVSKIPPTNITVKNIDGKPVAIAKMRFGRNTMDASGLVDQMLVIINGFTKKGDKIDTFKIGRAYIRGKDKDLSSTESWVMNVDEKGNASDFYEDF